MPVALIHKIPQIDVVKWRDSLRSIWNADPGVSTAKVTWLILFSQREKVQELRDTVKNKLIVRQLQDWDKRMAEYGARLARYREAILDSTEALASLETLVPYYSDPVFEGKYGALVEDGEIPWPGFVKPSMPDAMIGASLFNQLIGVLWVQQGLDVETRAFFGACIIGTPTSPALFGACLTAVAEMHIEVVRDAKDRLKQLGTDISEAADDAIDATANAINGMVSWFDRTAKAAFEGGAVFLKLAGVALVLGGAVFFYNRAFDNGTT